MRELVKENQEVIIIPNNYKFANRGKVKSVTAGDFILELEQNPDGILKDTYCEFYTQTPHGMLYFDSYAKEIKGNELTIASPSKHKFLQRRRHKRIKYANDLVIKSDDKVLNVSTMDISAGGLKFKSSSTLDIDKIYDVSIPTDFAQVDCKFSPIRIEKDGTNYIISGEFSYSSNKDKMLLVQYCEKRNVEINNK